MTVGSSPADITAADFAIKNTAFAEFASDDGLSGTALDIGTAYLIADSILLTDEKAVFESEDIGDGSYSYKRGKAKDRAVSIWMEKYNALLISRTSVTVSSAAIRKDADMQAVNIDQNAVPKFYEV